MCAMDIAAALDQAFALHDAGRWDKADAVRALALALAADAEALARVKARVAAARAGPLFVRDP